mmetsp:Transcript_35849/g.46056  ORF Transcript_35849/g.46056 Transcript_35849/m.46056 type:complete len:153 (-) Transcript_35849:355-813(-)|eukprot:CAMPEP_0117760766 /NCGR_PEP_ID=MMETSP0947-20121206/16843_1 /TAXON_ID=44440 /ORGANISM="Chattonella subsalsa, Strain CCMP2191" /LENGTH=152 /DNA_ID=CAMNT_0005581555 /DNA_START=1 /DNA_END=459 /DNA_ORIENTATION=-
MLSRSITSAWKSRSLTRCVNTSAIYSSAVNSVTYSGGQASEGQGGFYGSGGSRVKASKFEFHPEALAHAEDITALRSLMAQAEVLRDRLSSSDISRVSPEGIALKNDLRKMLTSTSAMELIERLEINGSPKWGLSQDERSLIREARDAINAC